MQPKPVSYPFNIEELCSTKYILYEFNKVQFSARNTIFIKHFSVLTVAFKEMKCRMFIKSHSKYLHPY